MPLSMVSDGEEFLVKKINAKAKTKMTSEYPQIIFLIIALLLIWITSNVKLIIPNEKKSERKAPKMQRGSRSVSGLWIKA